MHAVRPAAVAGMFYPGEARQLGNELDRLLNSARGVPRPAEAPKAIIAPHAGYIYSGATAAAAYRCIAALAKQVTRVILFGPAHRVFVAGMALPATTAFATPLGVVPIDQDLVAMARSQAGVQIDEAAHAQEHSLEVHLPFLQRSLAEFSVLPVAVGAARPADVAMLMERLWGGPETLVVVSSDLSHFHAYRQAQAIDGATVAQILAGSEPLNHEQACGATPVNALLMCAATRGMRIELLDARNSGDTAGDRSRVVGYASFALYERCAHAS